MHPPRFIIYEIKGELSILSEIVTEKLVCNNQEGNKKKKLIMLNIYENLLIYPTGKDMGKHIHKKACLNTQKLL